MDNSIPKGEVMSHCPPINRTSHSVTNDFEEMGRVGRAQTQAKLLLKIPGPTLMYSTPHWPGQAQTACVRAHEVCWRPMHGEADPIQFAAGPRQVLLLCVGVLWLQLPSRALSSVTAHKTSAHSHTVRSLCLQIAPRVDGREKGLSLLLVTCVTQKTRTSLTGPEITSRRD